MHDLFLMWGRVQRGEEAVLIQTGRHWEDLSDGNRPGITMLSPSTKSHAFILLAHTTSIQMTVV